MAIGFNELLRDNLIGRNSEERDSFGAAVAVGDFDNDGRDDLAIGVPGEGFTNFGDVVSGFLEIFDGVDFNGSIAPIPGTPAFGKGAVQVMYGSNQGFRDGSQELTQDNLSTANSEDGDGFGRALATGDINGDNFDDLIVGIPGEDGPHPNSGTLQVVFGSANGLDRDRTQSIGQNTPGIASQESDGEVFGKSFAVADFNRDGFDDVAVGAPGNRDFTNVRAGSVNIIYGSPTGLNESRRGDQFFNRNTSGILGVDREGDRFGSALIAGDFDDDGHQDLAIGTPGANFNGQNDAGAVTVLYGFNNGLTTRDSALSQGDSDFPAPDVITAGDELGSALAAADFNNDGVTDLAIGVPGEDNDVGAVQIHYGRRGANLPIGEQEGQVEFIQGTRFGGNPGDRFGSVLAAEDLNQDGFADLVVSSPGRDTKDSNTNSVSDVGAVIIFFGSANGLENSAFQSFTQSSASGLVDSPEKEDFFGSSLAIGDFNGAGSTPDIAVGSFDDIGSANDAGGVTIIPSGLLG